MVAEPRKNQAHLTQDVFSILYNMEIHNKYGDSDDHQHKDENKREGKEAGEMGWIPESERSPGGNPLHYS